MLAAFLKSISQLGDPRILRVLGWTVLICIGLLIGVWAGAWAGIASVPVESVSWLPSWIAGVFRGVAWLTSFLLSWLLFPVLSGAVMGLFLDAVMDAVERRHYPGLSAPRPQPMAEILSSALKFLALGLIVNLLLFPFYLFLGPFGLLLAILVNGYLIGREYFEMVALRRLEPAAAAALYDGNRGRVIRWGMAAAALALVPGVNLVAPIIATAMMVHLFQPLSSAARGSPAGTQR
ncbi:MAG: EI24 domain-containing protein [Alphaproteobacteria bacterium]|nr:EI24 domain-containing protein [Alphaproteobacteria bacterium]